MSTTNPVLVEAYTQIRSGQLKAARQNLRAAIKTNPNSERAWLLMSLAVTEPAQKLECLKRVLSLNPHHAEAQHQLSLLQPAPEIIAPAPNTAEEIAPPAVEESAPQPEEPLHPIVEAEPETPVAEEPAPEPEAGVLAAPGESGVAEVEPIVEAAAEIPVEATPIEEAPTPATLEPAAELSPAEDWSAEPEGLPEWLIVQSLVDETLPDIEPPLAEGEEYEEETEAEAEPAAADVLAPESNAETVISASAPEEAASAALEEQATEAPPVPRAKRRRARRLHTDYLAAHAQIIEEELPAWLLDEAERTSPGRLAKPAAPAPQVLAPPPPPPSTPVAAPPPAPILEPAPIRARPTVAATTEPEPLPKYYGSTIPQGSTPGWVMPVMLLVWALVVFGVVTLLIYLVLR